MLYNRETQDTPSPKAASSKLFVFTAPSGAGKTTIVRHLLKKIDELAFSISATTRAKREGEIDGKDYYFIGIEEFKRKIEAGDFVEWEEVYPNQFYGTLKSEIERLRGMGKSIIFDIDVQGALDIKRLYKNEVLAVFIQPPSQEILFERLRNRKTEDKKSLEKRIAKAGRELTFSDHFDTVLVNDILNLALLDAEMFVKCFLSVRK